MSMQPKGEPIMIRCEGSGGPGNLPGMIGAMCQMCGSWYPLTDAGVIPEHQRDDILARIDRGDFD